MRKHTPGPWQVHSGWIIDQHHRIVGDSFSGKEMGESCQMEDCNSNPISAVESDNNRNLMAHAPEMLQALRQAEDGLASALATWREENGDNVGVIGALRFVRRAIKEVE